MRRSGDIWAAIVFSIATAVIIVVLFGLFGCSRAEAVELIKVTSLDGRVIQINPHQITRLQPSNAGTVLAERVECVIHLTDGSFTSVVEKCDKVRELMEGKP